MTFIMFLVAAANAVLAYFVMGRLWEQWRRGSFLRRLSRRGAGGGGKPTENQPRLIRADVNTRLVAARALERLRIKRSAEGVLETAALKWGAAGLLHRSK